MSNRIDWFSLLQQEIYFQNILYFFPLFFLIDYEVFPVSVFVANETPVYTKDKIEKENKSHEKMDKPDRSEPVTKRCLLPALEGQRVTNEETRDAKNDYRDGGNPVEKPHRNLPNIFSSER